MSSGGRMTNSCCRYRTVGQVCRPDLVIMGIRLAGAMDGIEAAREIIARYGIPIIFVTGYSSRETIRQAKELNPIAYLEKPVQIPSLP